MERIICVEQPLHKFVDFRASSALSVIEEQERYGEHRAELYKPVYLIYRKEIDNGIDHDPEHAPRYLLFRLYIILSDAMQLQSAGSAAAQMSRVRITFTGIPRRSSFATRSITSPHASDHMTPV